MLGLCWWLLDRQTTETVTEKIDWVGSLCSMGTLFSLTLMLVKGSDWGWTSSVVIGLGVFSLVALVSFIVVEAHVEQPMMPLALFHNRQFTGAALITIISGVFMVALLVLLPNFFTKVQGKTELMAALMISPASMMIFLFSPISGFVLAKVGPRAVILSGILAIIAGYVGLSRLNPDHYWQLLIVLLLVGAGYGMIIGPITVLAAGDFTGKLLTASQSVIGVFRQIGTSLAVAIFVSALSTNLVTAKHQVWQTAQGAVANLTVSAKVKQDTLAAVRAQLATEKVASGTSKHFITPAKTRHLIRQNYAQVIKQQRLALAPVPVRRVVYRRVQRTVIATVVHDNQQIATVVTKVKATSKTALTGAFMRPYQVAMPVTFSMLPLLISFKRRRDARRIPHSYS